MTHKFAICLYQPDMPQNLGVIIRTAGLEAPTQIGRGERHGGIFKSNLKHLVKVFRIVGKNDMKVAASVAIAYDASSHILRGRGYGAVQ